jgi:nitrite reductase (NO-forming)
MEEDKVEITPQQKNNTLPVVLGLIVLLVLGGIAYYFFNSRNATDTTIQLQPTDETAQGEETSESQVLSEQIITVEGGEFYLEPNEIRVKQGERVTINFTNVKGFHDFVLDEFEVRTQQIPADSTATVSFLADKTGTFEYYCSVGQHRQNGMVGTLIVSQ